MSLIKAIKTQLGLSVTPANNFTFDASADNGTMKLARESGQDIMTVNVEGKVAFPQNSKVSFMAVANTDPFVSIPANTPTTCKFPTVIHGNSGGWFSTSTGIFTAPVAGIYTFSCAMNFSANFTADKTLTAGNNSYNIDRLFNDNGPGNMMGNITLYLAAGQQFMITANWVGTGTQYQGWESWENYLFGALVAEV